MTLLHVTVLHKKIIRSSGATSHQKSIVLEILLNMYIAINHNHNVNNVLDYPCFHFSVVDSITFNVIFLEQTVTCV